MSEHRAVLDMMDRRPIWAMPGWVPEELRTALPADWELVVIEEETSGSGDGAARVSTTVLDAVAVAEIYMGYGIGAEILTTGTGLRWVHTGAAGVGSSLTPEMLASGVVFTNSAGVHAPPMAETVLGMLLFFFRGLDFAVANQREARWSADPYYVAGAPLLELSAATVGVVGFGGVGREVARRVAGLGARVVALRRTAAEPGAADLTPVAGAGGSLADRIEVLHGPAGLDRLLESSDAVVLTTPYTAETRGMIDEAALRRMKPGAVLVNVARGKVIEEPAFLAAIERGGIRGAGLDVFWKEPLPAGHPLWGSPRVLITPHVSAVTRGFWRRETDLILRNLERYLEGSPVEEWENVVDKLAGY